MKKKKRCLQWCSVGLSVIATILSIVALCKCCSRTSDSELFPDYIGAIVGVLCVLVTVIVGLNIYNIIDFRENIAMLKQHEKDIKWLYKNKENGRQKEVLNPGEPMPRNDDLTWD